MAAICCRPIVSLRELIESFDKKSGRLMADYAKDARRYQPVRDQGGPETWQAGRQTLTYRPAKNQKRWNADGAHLPDETIICSLAPLPILNLLYASFVAMITCSAQPLRRWRSQRLS